MKRKTKIVWPKGIDEFCEQFAQLIGTTAADVREKIEIAIREPSPDDSPEVVEIRKAAMAAGFIRRH